MAYTIAFFGSKPYDEASFNEKNSEYGFELRYYKGHLNRGSHPANGGKRSEAPCPALRRI